MEGLYGGIDIGSESHHIVIMDANEEIHYDGKIPHRLEALNEAIERFHELENEKGPIAFAIEGKNGYGAPFDRFLLEAGFILYNVDNLKLCVKGVKSALDSWFDF
ncbi:MAG TPA: transposase [Desulfobacteraceae bacterium]|nr:transposase [Desulfobacteraceae bacterium]